SPPLGVRPRWDRPPRRGHGLGPIPVGEPGPPRIDVTLRISGFFRDAFPHVIALLDAAVALVGSLDEDAASNPVRAAGADDARMWGPPPGGYGSCILPILEHGSWRTQSDLADVELARSAFPYAALRDRGADPRALRT